MLMHAPYLGRVHQVIEFYRHLPFLPALVLIASAALVTGFEFPLKIGPILCKTLSHPPKKHIHEIQDVSRKYFHMVF